DAISIVTVFTQNLMNSLKADQIQCICLRMAFFEVDVNKSDVPAEQDINNDTASTYRQGLMYNVES
ncbi:MAG: hypothetical protein MJY94_07195, partial [Bacteroidales bacterium]|nr:hypothetical protein [Bacteroidales bacterium]